MKSSTFLVALLPLALCLTLPVDAITGGASKLVQEVCAKSARKEMCLSSLQSDPGSLNADANTLMTIAIKLAQANATDTAEYIQGMINNDSLEPGVQQALSDCSDGYVDAVQQLDDTVAALTVKNYKDVNTFVNVAIGDVDSCEAGFKRLASDDMLLSSRNLVFRQLCNNILAIASNHLA